MTMNKSDLVIIAELAQGCEGDFELAKMLIKSAAKADADIVKFQMVYADELATPDYQYYELFTQLEFSAEQWRTLSDYARELKVELAMDVFGHQSLDVCGAAGINIIKLHPTDVTNNALLRAINESPITEVILGVGGAHLNEIKHAITTLGNNKSITLLHGFQAYPTPLGASQLSRLTVLQNELSAFQNLHYGFADHEPADSPFSDTLPAMSLGFGATVVEKHFTLSLNLELEDSESALGADLFKTFANNIRTLHSAIGKENHADDFGMSEEEATYRKNIRRHVLLKADTAAGTVLADEDVVLKRSASEQPIYRIDEVVGKALTADMKAGTALEKTHLK